MPMSTQAVQQQSTEFPYFTEEHELIRQTVTRFCKEEIAPYAAEWDDEGIFPRELFNKAGALGMFGIRIDPKWGGSGQDWWATAAYVEAMIWSSPARNCGLPTARDATTSHWPSAPAAKGVRGFRLSCFRPKPKVLPWGRSSRRLATWLLTQRSCSSTNAACRSATFLWKKTAAFITSWRIFRASGW